MDLQNSNNLNSRQVPTVNRDDDVSDFRRILCRWYEILARGGTRSWLLPGTLSPAGRAVILCTREPSRTRRRAVAPSRVIRRANFFAVFIALL